MNLLSKEFKLDQTWSNSSGLTLNPNYSSPEAIIILTAVAIRNPIFHRIVNSKSFEIDIKNERFGINRRVVWRNTNKLLDCGW
jgi:D-alanyl-D-alanine carboxypeptidase